jgi:hypothetical protein
MRHSGTIALCTALAVSGCASTGGMPSMQSVREMAPGQRPSAAATPPENFAYAPAKDRDIRVSVGRVVLAGDKDFIPSDPNWLQIHITIANIGSRTVKIDDVKQKLADGTVVMSAKSGAELIKPPSFVKSGLTTVGVGTAGMMVGALLFPPAMIASGAYIAFAPMFQADRMQKTLAKVQQQGLKAETVAQGTSTQGYIFSPAISGQTALIVFYQVDGQVRTLEVPRTR